jgi:hypothetical protein
MIVRGLAILAGLCLLGLAPSAAVAAGLSGSNGSTVHASPDSINAALALDDAPQALDPDAHAKGKKEAPAAVAAAKLPCTVTDGYYIGGGAGKDKVYTDYYEVACQQGLGYILGVRKGNPTPTTTDCVIMALTPDGKPNPQRCRLPGNHHPYLGLQAMVSQAGHTCTVNNGHFLGGNDAVLLYEVACSEGGGYILEVDHKGSNPPKTANCLIYAANAGAIKCTLVGEAAQNSYVDKMVAASGKPCTVTDRRYVASTTDGLDFYEVACSDKSGFMIKTTANGGYSAIVPCSQASGIADGCKLTDAREAMTKEAGLYSNLAKKAGFSCDVSKYADFTSSDPNLEVVELACSNRPDGGVGFFPADAGKSRVLDCLRAEAEGYQCSFTPTSALYANLTEQLRAKGKTSCVVSNAASHGYADAPGGGKEDFVEVACADGGPGYVMHYVPGQALPVELLNCAQVKSTGGCKLSKIS